MTGRGKKAAAPKKKANGYKMPAPIPNGEVIHDTIMKKKWRIGPSIGVGGFGEIYSACDHESSPKKGSNYPYVVKIEPHENGPLFVEKHFYVRNANKDDIAKFAKTKKLSSIGMPTYYGNGSHNYNGEKYRYLVLERYGKDLWSEFESSGRSFPAGTVFQIGLQILDVLEYIHSRGYVHADIKAANILLGLKKGTENQAYLVDFGLATRVNEKEFKPDPKCAHNGTIEYTSRDAHQGVATMRGDLEILGYNMLHWLTGALPWERALATPRAVQDMKEGFMRGARGAAARLGGVPEPLIKFFEYVNTLKPKDTPDYTKCRNLFEGYLKTEGRTRNSKLEFTTSKKGKASKQAVYQSESEEDVKPKATKKKATENGVIKKVVKRAKPTKVVIESDSETENCENETPNSSVDSKVVKKKVVKRAKPTKVVKESDPETENCENETPYSSVDNKVVKRKVVRKAKPAKVVKVSQEVDSESENFENETPNSSVDSKLSKNKVVKRKSMEPAVVVKIKKAKVSKATPPVKKNHVNMSTQTSGQKRKSPRQVSFDSPICAVIADKKPRSANSSADIFEDSFVIEEKKVKPKKRLLRDVAETVERVVRKKVSTVKPKAKSWKLAPAVVNGRSPPG